MQIKIVPVSTSCTPGRLAEAELHFTDGPLSGMKLIGFSVWERRDGGRNVTFPARQYSVNGERRSFALLRPAADHDAQDRIRLLILAAYDRYAQETDGTGTYSYDVPDGPHAPGTCRPLCPDCARRLATDDDARDARLATLAAEYPDASDRELIDRLNADVKF